MDQTIVFRASLNYKARGMPQAHHLKLLRSIESKGEAGCTEDDLKAFDKAIPGTTNYPLIAFELVAMGVLQHNWITRIYTITSQGQRYKERMEDRASQEP